MGQIIQRGRPKEITPPINFILGVILFSVAVVFMFQRKAFGINMGQLHAFLLAISGVMSLWASTTPNGKTVFIINIALGVAFVFGSAFIGILQWGLPTGDLLTHGLIGLVFFLNGLFWRRRHLRRKSHR